MKKSAFKLRSGNTPLKLNLDIFGIGRGFRERRNRRIIQRANEERAIQKQQDDYVGKSQNSLDPIA